jgi:hypothetical protein
LAQSEQFRVTALLAGQRPEKLRRPLAIGQPTSQPFIDLLGSQLQIDTTVDELGRRRHRAGLGQQRKERLIAAGNQGPKKDVPSKRLDRHEGVGQNISFSYRPNHLVPSFPTDDDHQEPSNRKNRRRRQPMRNFTTGS